MNQRSARYVSPANTTLVFLLLTLLILACSDYRTQPTELSPPGPDPISETWIGDSLEALHINNRTDTNARHKLSNAQGFTLSVSLCTDSTFLYFQSPYSILRKHTPAGSLKQYTLKIDQRTDSSLTLTPVSDEARAFFKGRRRLLFRKQA